MFYGYGTNWHPAYYPTLALTITHCFTVLYGLRYRLATWEAFTLVKLFGAITICILSEEYFCHFQAF